MEKEVFSVCMNEQEIYLCLKHGTERRTGPVLRIVETVCMGLLFVYCLVAFIIDPSQSTSLVLAVTALALGILLWAVPEKKFRSMAREAAERGMTVTVTVSETGLAFGEDQEEYRYEQLQCIRLPQLRVLVFSTQLVGLPDRVFSEKVLQLWDKVLPAAEGEKV